MTANNVIQFPGRPKKIALETTDENEFVDLVNEELTKSLQIEETINLIAIDMVEKMYYLGFKCDYEKSDLKDFVLILEAIRSMLYKQHKFDHPLQKFSDKVFHYNNGIVKLVQEKI